MPTAVLERRPPGRSGKRNIVGWIWFGLALAAVLTVVLVPYGWMVSGSFKSSVELQAADVTRPGQEPSWIPREPTLDNYRNVNRTVRILDYLRNSLIISTGTMVLATTLALLAAYALSRWAFPGRNAYVVSVLSTQMLPGILFLIPYFILFTWLRNQFGIQLRDTYVGMIITYTSFALPFSIVMLRSFLDSIPVELDEQAQIDGASRLRILFSVLLPLARPGIVSVAIYCFIMGWNEVLFASVLTGTSTRTVAVGLLEYITAHEARWTMMMAASIIVSVPVLVLFSFLQRYVISGLVSGAV
ncbi:MAG: carbohydrate ABC transporter permease, partial [Bacillota bacterium]